MEIDGRVRLIVAILVLCGGFILGSCQRTQPPPPVIPEVATVTIQPERVVLTTELPGRTYSYFVAEIRPQVSGIIQKRLFDEGSDVTAGDVLYQIDPASFKAAYDNAVANLAVMREAADRARAALEASIAGVERQRATLMFARTNRRRFEELFEDKAVSAGDRDQAVTEAEVAEATLRVTEAQVKSDQKAVAAAEAAIQQAEAALETARINLGYTRITAPITGRIGKSDVTVGALVTAHQPTALAVIQQLDPIFVNATQASVNLLRLKRNISSGWIKGGGPNQTRVKLLLEDGTPYPLQGTLKFSDVTVDPGTGSFILRMIFPNPNHFLLPGMYIRALVQEGIVDRAILVPQQAITRNPKGIPIAMVVSGSNQVEQRTLKIDRAIDDKWLVVSGLAQGDRVIVEGLQRVRPGASVKVLPFDSEQKKTENHGEKPRPATKSN